MWFACGHCYDDVVVIGPLTIGSLDPSEKYFNLTIDEFCETREPLLEDKKSCNQRHSATSVCSRRIK